MELGIYRARVAEDETGFDAILTPIEGGAGFSYRGAKSDKGEIKDGESYKLSATHASPDAEEKALKAAEKDAERAREEADKRAAQEAKEAARPARKG